MHGSDSAFGVFFCFAVQEKVVTYHTELPNWHEYYSLHLEEMLERRLYAPWVLP